MAPETTDIPLKRISTCTNQRKYFTFTRFTKMDGAGHFLAGSGAYFCVFREKGKAGKEFLLNIEKYIFAMAKPERIGFAAF
jgi:hypothetical protein